MKLPLNRSAHSVLVLAVLCTVANAGAIGLPNYSVVDFHGRKATALNEAGTVVGVSGHVNSGNYMNTPHTPAFVADGTGMPDLGTLGGYRSTATAINNAGQVVGYSEVDKNDKEFWYATVHAFLSDGHA